MKRSQAGFSLVETVVVGGIAMIIMLGIVTIMDNLYKSNLNNQQQAEATHLHEDIYALLRDPKACLNSFAIFPLRNVGQPYSHVANLSRADRSIAFTIGTIWAINKLEIKQMRLGDFTADNVTNPDSGKAWLHVTINKLGQPIGSQSLLRDIKSQVMQQLMARLQNVAQTNTLSAAVGSVR